MPNTTVADCSLDGEPIELLLWPTLSSAALERIVGEQQPGNELESAGTCLWSFESVPLDDLRACTEDGDEPDDGWIATYARYLAQDQEAVSGGSPDYAGRDDWIRNAWSKDTSIYPLYLVNEAGEWRLWDGHRRLAGAFHFGLTSVFAVVGRPR